MQLSHPAVALIVVAALAPYACSAPSSAPLQPDPSVVTPVMESKVLLVSTTSGFTAPAELVLRDDAALAAAWKTANAGTVGSPAPSIDFASQMVVLVALGERRTGGYTVRIDSVSRDAGGALVRYTATSPGPSCMTAQMITAPVIAVAVPRVDGTVRFQRSDATDRC